MRPGFPAMSKLPCGTPERMARSRAARFAGSVMGTKTAGLSGTVPGTGVVSGLFDTDAKASGAHAESGAKKRDSCTRLKPKRG